MQLRWAGGTIENYREVDRQVASGDRVQAAGVSQRKHRMSLELPRRPGGGKYRIEKCFTDLGVLRHLVERAGNLGHPGLPIVGALAMAGGHAPGVMKNRGVSGFEETWT